ncbi:hypothetical protein B0A50_02978 [Salinomyces thailandicus]|uniref:Uncharacterized protein n=1 Tax=Salinomyces thailandicus TaxID=706561 RepID=A0A4U0U162_9PEZI|nr:hypothetical protein B0A50_02978 [Salinomyces thailandica]
MTDYQGEQILNQHMLTIAFNLDYMSHQIEAHGDTVLKRWQVKSCKSRIALLLKEMPKGGLFGEDGESQVKQANEMTFPWSHFLSLINQRSTVSAATLLPFDVENLKATHDSLLVSLPYQPHYVSIEAGSFGQLVNRDMATEHPATMIRFTRVLLAAIPVRLFYLPSQCD